MPGWAFSSMSNSCHNSNNVAVPGEKDQQFRPSQRSLLPIKPFPQVSDTDAVCFSEPRCGKLSGVQSFADLFVTRSKENGSLFDGYCNSVKQWVI